MATVSNGQVPKSGVIEMYGPPQSCSLCLRTGNGLAQATSASGFAHINNGVEGYTSSAYVAGRVSPDV